jgi:hypothetical protein
VIDEEKYVRAVLGIAGNEVIVRSLYAYRRRVLR